jgi:hypothetical protein
VRRGAARPARDRPAVGRDHDDRNAGPGSGVVVDGHTRARFDADARCVGRTDICDPD